MIWGQSLVAHVHSSVRVIIEKRVGYNAGLNSETKSLRLFQEVLIVFGGWDGAEILDSTEFYDPSIGSWSTGAKLPQPMSGLKATNIKARVLLFGNDGNRDIKHNRSYIYRVLDWNLPKVNAYCSQNMSKRDFLSILRAPKMWSI